MEEVVGSNPTRSTNLPSLIAPASGPRSGATYHMTMRFGGTVLYVDQLAALVDFYRRAFELELRFFDEALEYAEIGDWWLHSGTSRPLV